MKIIHVISGYLGQGGAERLVVDLAEAQAEMGHDVTICTFRNRNEMSIPIPQRINCHSFGKKKGLSLILSFRIASFLKNETPDVVNCHLPAVFPYLIWSLLTCKKTKFFYTIHSNPLDEEPRKSVRKLRKIFIENGKLTFVGISDMVSRDFVELYGLNKQVPVVFNGRKMQQPTNQYDTVKAEIDNFRNNVETKVFLAVGRLTKEKNYKLMLDAFERLKDENVTLVALGKDYDGFLERYKDDIPSNVHFLGGKSNVSDYLFNADCFVMSSLYEGLPISIIEAMSAGLPIVSTAVGGIPDIVKDGVNGFLSESLKVDDFVKTIKRHLSTPENELLRMKETNKKEYLERYTIEKTAEQYLALYKE